MTLVRASIAILSVLSLVGCANLKYGDKETEAKLRELKPVPGKTSLYVCREKAAFVGAGNRTTAMVDNQDIGTMTPNNFTHTVVEPGKHDIHVKLNPGGNSGTLTIQTLADEVPILWVGVTGGGFGALTVDHFSSRSEAEACVKGAEYAIPAN